MGMPGRHFKQLNGILQGSNPGTNERQWMLPAISCYILSRFHFQTLLTPRWSGACIKAPSYWSGEVQFDFEKMDVCTNMLVVNRCSSPLLTGLAIPVWQNWQEAKPWSLRLPWTTTSWWLLNSSKRRFLQPPECSYYAAHPIQQEQSIQWRGSR